MSQLFLVRHGQASFGAADYDQLSPLGLQQAQWLGEYFQEIGVTFHHVLSGTLKRQQQTASAILQGLQPSASITTDARLNEFDFHTLVSVYCQHAGIDFPGTGNGGRAFFQTLRLAMQAWARDELHRKDDEQPAHALETWQEFHDRVHGVLHDLISLEHKQNVLAVSSGGTMAMAVSQVLRCDVNTLIDLNMQTRNTAIHHFHVSQRGMQMTTFNSLPHLQRKDRLRTLTYS